MGRVKNGPARFIFAQFGINPTGVQKRHGLSMQYAMGYNFPGTGKLRLLQHPASRYGKYEIIRVSSFSSLPYPLCTLPFTSILRFVITTYFSMK